MDCVPERRHTASCDPLFPEIPHDGQGGHKGGDSVFSGADRKEIFEKCVCGELLRGRDFQHSLGGKAI